MLSAVVAGELASHTNENDRQLIAKLTPVLDRAERVRVSLAQKRSGADLANIDLLIGNATLRLGERSADAGILQRAIAAYESALKVRTQVEMPVDCAVTQNNLGAAYQTLGERSGDEATLKSAIAAYENALNVYTQAEMPVQWAMTQNNLGNAYLALGERSGDEARLKRAIAAFENALKVRTPAEMPVDWAMTQNNLGNAYLALGERSDDEATLKSAIAAYENALTVFTEGSGLVVYRNIALAGLKRARELLDKKNSWACAVKPAAQKRQF